MYMPSLETVRLLIRPFEMSDLDAIFQILDVELGKGAGDAVQVAQVRAERREWLEWSVLNYTALANLHQPPYGDRAIVLRANGAVIKPWKARSMPRRFRSAKRGITSRR